MSKGEKIIFFDFDGTVCDTSGYVHDVLMKVLDEIDFRISKKDFKRNLKEHMGKKLDGILRGLGVTRPDMSLITKRFYNYLMGGVSKDRITLCRSLKPLKELKKKGYRFIIITNNDREFVNRALGILRVKSLFSEVYGDQDFETKDEILLKLIEENNLKGKKTLYVGDRFSDISMAHRAHLSAVAIHNEYSVSSRKLVLSQKPDYIISDFEGLKEIVLKSEK